MNLKSPVSDKARIELRNVILAQPGIRPYMAFETVAARIGCAASTVSTVAQRLQHAGHIISDNGYTWSDVPTFREDPILVRRVIRKIPAASVHIDMPRYPNAMAWVAGEIGRAA
jgi:hypothetical protein